MKQEEILLKLVQGEDGKAWAGSLYGWSQNSDVPACDWTGIDCEWDDGEVTGISLADTNLVATLPPELGYLKKLKTLNLSSNIIMGDIPLAVANLPELETFEAKDNQISGPLPKFASTMLRILDFENNNLSQGLPEDIGEGHPEMVNFDVVNNQITGTLPNSITKMTNLIWLQLSQNHFFGSLPAGLGNLKNLRFLYLDANNFMGEIPRELTLPGSVLTEVWFHNNLFSGTVPAAFADIPALKNLYVDGNKFTGELPEDLCKPEINEDFFEDFNVALSARDYCESIACPPSYSSIEGVWPCEPCAPGEINPYLGREGSCFPKDQSRILREFFEATSGENWTGDNDWFKSGNPNLCQFSGVTCNANGQVRAIELSGRSLQGSIPASIGFLEHMDTLDLSNNNLEGFLPSDLRFAPLTKLDISGNKLMGIVPPKLCMKTMNGNGIDGAFRCDLVACPEGTYSNTGMADDRTCMPCNDGENYIGKTSCGPEPPSVTSSPHPLSAGAVAGIVFAVLAATIFLAVAVYRYRRTLKEDIDHHELTDFDLSDNHPVSPSTYVSRMPPPSDQLFTGTFPDQVTIEEMDDDFSSITRVRKKKTKRKKKKESASYDSVITEENGDGRSEDSNPLWLDVPRLDNHTESSPTPYHIT